MGENSKISWTDNTFNPWIGCTKVGPGCDHCYAEESLPAKFMGIKWGAGQPRHRTTKSNWKKPLSWNKKAKEDGKRIRVFCASLADVFDNEVPSEWRTDLFQLIRETPNLDWIILTKRIGNVEKMLPPDWGAGYPNVWLVITVVNQEEAKRDCPKLRDIHAVVHGLSIEPMLAPIDFAEFPREDLPSNHWFTELDYLDWVICGAESGLEARPFNEDWVRTLQAQCEATETAFFYKQIIRDGVKVETPELDGRRWTEFPEVSA